jgi:hypothetical protein
MAKRLAPGEDLFNCRIPRHTVCPTGTCEQSEDQRVSDQFLVYRIGHASVALGALQQVDALAVSGDVLVPDGFDIRSFIGAIRIVVTLQPAVIDHLGATIRAVMLKL